MQSDHNDLLENQHTDNVEIPPHLPVGRRKVSGHRAEKPEQYWRWVLLPSILLVVCVILYWLVGRASFPLGNNPTPTVPFYSDVQFLDSRRSTITNPATEFEEKSCWVTVWIDMDEVPVFDVTDTTITQSDVLTNNRARVFRPTREKGWYQLAEYYPDHQGQGIVLDDYFTGVCEAN